MKITEDLHFQEYLSIKNPKPSTEKNIYQRLKLYFIFIGKTPTEVITTAEHEEDKRLRMKNRTVKKDLISFLNYLLEQKYSENYLRGVMSTVRSFYRGFDIELPNIRIPSNQQNETFTTADIIQKKHIKYVLKYADPKWRAIVLLMSSSGMGSAEIRQLTFQDLYNAISRILTNNSNDIGEAIRKNPTFIPCWNIRRQKTGMPYYTFSTPESLKFMADYLDDVTIPDDLNKPLFSTRTGNHITPNIMSYNFNKLNNKAHFGKRNGRLFFHSHGLRKYFASTLYSHGLPKMVITGYWGTESTLYHPHILKQI